MTEQEPTASEVVDAVQAAVDGTATAYAGDATLDVEARLRAELAGRGADLDDEEWLAEVATAIRSGHPVVVDGPTP